MKQEKVANVIKKILRGDKETHDKGEITPIQKILEREIADVIICCDLLAAKYDIDLEKAIVEKFNRTSNQRNYPILM